MLTNFELHSLNNEKTSKNIRKKGSNKKYQQMTYILYIYFMEN